MILGAVGASGREGNTAVENWLEVSTFGTGRVRATVICFGMGASAEGADSGILATRFNVTKPPAIIALLGGGRRVGALDDELATEDWNLGEIRQDLPVIGRHLHHD